jgi:hypothetical protein
MIINIFYVYFIGLRIIILIKLLKKLQKTRRSLLINLKYMSMVIEENYDNIIT